MSFSKPILATVDAAKIFGVQFQVNVPSANYDIFIDDLKFICQ